MRKFKDITIFILGKTLNNQFYPKNQKIQLPKETIVSLEWEGNIGRATNFRQVKDKVLCDILLNNESAKRMYAIQKYTLVPKIRGDRAKPNTMEDLELLDVSIVLCPADEELAGNLKKKR